MMRFLFFFLLLSSSVVVAQPEPETPELSDYNIRKTVLTNIDRDRDSMNERLQGRINDLETRLKNIDMSINESANVNQRLTGMVDRIKTIEDIQNATMLNEVATYQGNYQTALINLVSMERELQPLILFQASRDFYMALGDVANLSDYAGFAQWWSGFKQHADRNKTTHPAFAMASSAIGIATTFATGGVVSGPVVSAVMMGVTEYIQSMRKQDEPLRRQSTEMLTLITTVSQFAHEKGLVDNEWEAISHELEELGKLYKAILERNLLLVNLQAGTFQSRFSADSDPARRLQFLNELSATAAKVVAEKQRQSPGDWKATYHYEMMAVQALRIRFGQLALRIVEHLDHYEKLTNRYRSNPVIGTKVSRIGPKLDQLRLVFNRTFNPTDYIQSAETMYRVY